MFGYILALLIIYVTVKVIQRWRDNQGLPPGPTGLPILGMTPWIKPEKAHLLLTEWSKQYGPLLSFWNGSTLVIVLADLRVMKEALLKQADIFTGRPRTRGGALTHKNHGLLQSDGPRWKDQRRFALSTLRDFGFGKPILENKIKEEAECVLEELARLNGAPTDLQMLLNNSVSNIIVALVFGKRFDYNDPNFLRLLDHFSFIATRNGQNIMSVHNFLPFLTMFRRARGKEALRRIRLIEQFCQELIEEHEKTYSKDEEPEDYIHAFMAAKEKAGDGPTTFTDFQLLQSVISLFVAGTETTSTTLRWALLLLCQHPELQDKLRKEMADLVGPGNIPNLSDRSRLPYVDATIFEIQRIANLVPLSLPHRTEADTELDGYRIPKDALVIPLLWAVHEDPNIYPDPTKFNPERFLKDGKLVKSDALVPFSIGKRACLGESLAKMELFIFLVSLFARFKFELAPGEYPSTDYINDRIVGTTSSPLNFKVKATPVSLLH